jgi:hypothetical protein
MALTGPHGNKLEVHLYRVALISSELLGSFSIDPVLLQEETQTKLTLGIELGHTSEREKN